MRQQCLAVVTVMLAVGSAWALDWPRFRGPTGQGHADATDLPVRWSDSQNVAWKVTVPGNGWSSPILHKGRLYLTTAVPRGNDVSLRTLCIDAASGKTLWVVEVFKQDGATAPRIHRKNSHASPTPLIDGDRLFVHFGHQGTACLGLDGKIVWQNRTLRYRPVHGNGGTPVLVDDALIFSCDGAKDPFVVALRRDTGKVLWKTPRKTDAARKFSFSTPLVITVAGQKQVISPGSNAVCAYDPKTGREIWRVRYDGYSVIPKPVFGHGLLFMSTGFDRPSVLAIRPDGRGDVTDTHVVWKLTRGAPHTPSLLLVGDELYMVSDGGAASCVDARTAKLHWRQRIGTAFSASPVYADGRIYFQSEGGVGVVIKAGRQFEELGRNDMKERTLASYAVGDGALFIRTASHLYRIAASK